MLQARFKQLGKYLLNLVALSAGSIIQTDRSYTPNGAAVVCDPVYFKVALKLKGSVKPEIKHFDSATH